MSIRIKNEGKRKIQFGKTEEESFLPGKVAIVGDELGKRHLKMFKRELVDIDNLTVSYDVGDVKDFTGEDEEVADKKKIATKPKKSEYNDDELSKLLKA